MRALSCEALACFAERGFSASILLAGSIAVDESITLPPLDKTLNHGQTTLLQQRICWEKKKKKPDLRELTLLLSLLRSCAMCRTPCIPWDKYRSQHRAPGYSTLCGM